MSLPGTGLRVAIVGGGFMARVHSQAARAAGATVVGVVGSSPESSRRAAAQLGIERAFDDFDEMLAASDVDVVHVCTPNALHAPQALAAIAAGKHVVCEKPLATTAEVSAAMVDAAEEAGVVATVPFVYRFHPLVREMRARVRSGAVGDLLTVSGAYLQDWLGSATDDNWRVDPAIGGESRAFADIGSHLVDLLEFVTGDRVARIAAVKRTFFTERFEHSTVSTEDAVALVMETARGALGTILVSQAAPGRKNRLTLEIAGTSSSAAFNQERPEELWVGRRDGNAIVLRDPEHLSDDAARLSVVPAGHPQGYQDAFNAFVADTYAAVAGAQPEGLPRFSDGARAATITESVMAAARSGAWVLIPPQEQDAASRRSEAAA